MVNKVILVGRVGQDPETRAAGGTNVSKFSIATTEKYKDKNGEKKADTEWHNLELWGKLSDIAAQWVKKGQMIYIEGSLKTDSWEDNGVKKYATKIRVSNMTMLGDSKNAQAQSAPAATPIYPTNPTSSHVPISEQETDDLPF